MSDKATPRPWSHSAGTIYDGQGDPVADMVDYDPNSPHIDAVAIENHISERIERILRAVNSHDALVEALSNLLSFVDGLPETVATVVAFQMMAEGFYLHESKAALALTRGET